MDNCYLNTVCRVLEAIQLLLSRKAGNTYFTSQTEILETALSVGNGTINNFSTSLKRSVSMGRLEIQRFDLEVPF